MAGNGELAYTALVTNVRLLPIDSDLTQTLRMGSEHFRRRYGVAVAAGTAPILRGVVELPGVAREADRWGAYVAVDETSDLVVIPFLRLLGSGHDVPRRRAGVPERSCYPH